VRDLGIKRALGLPLPGVISVVKIVHSVRAYDTISKLSVLMTVAGSPGIFNSRFLFEIRFTYSTTFSSSLLPAGESVLHLASLLM